MLSAMRANTTQKAYDEAFLACSTAVYFEGQVRSRWKPLGIICSTNSACCRTTRRKLCDPGRRLSTTSATTTPAATPRRTAPPPKQNGPCWSPCDSWSCSARSEWICWKPSRRLARLPRKVCPRCPSMRMRRPRRPTVPRHSRRIQMPSIAGLEEARCHPWNTAISLGHRHFRIVQQ